jgi:hypothetical protein
MSIKIETILEKHTLSKTEVGFAQIRHSLVIKFQTDRYILIIINN